MSKREGIGENRERERGNKVEQKDKKIEEREEEK